MKVANQIHNRIFSLENALNSKINWRVKDFHRILYMPLYHVNFMADFLSMELYN